MIAAELRGGSKPSLNEALGWIGSRVDDINGVAIGRLEDVWIDPATGEPRWLLVKEGRFGGRSTLVPFDDAVPGDGHVWIPYERDVVREAPQVEPAVPLTQQVEMTLRNHYAANTTAAVSQGAQPPDPAAAEAPEPEQGGTVRLAPAQPVPDPGEVPPPRMPERPAPPVNAPPPLGDRPEQQGAFTGQSEPPQQPFQQQPAPQQQPPPQQPPAPQQHAGPQQQQPPPQAPPASPHTAAAAAPAAVGAGALAGLGRADSARLASSARLPAASAAAAGRRRSAVGARRAAAGTDGRDRAVRRPDDQRRASPDPDRPARAARLPGLSRSAALPSAQAAMSSRACGWPAR